MGAPGFSRRQLPHPPLLRPTVGSHAGRGRQQLFNRHGPPAPRASLRFIDRCAHRVLRQGPPRTPSKAVTVWLAIDDADFTYTLTENDYSNVLTPTVSSVEEWRAPVDNELRAGEASIHSDLLVHGSEANASHRRRCGLTLRYCPADVRAELGWTAKGVTVSGKDPTGHWANPGRPRTESTGGANVPLSHWVAATVNSRIRWSAPAGRPRAAQTGCRIGIGRYASTRRVSRAISQSSSV
jgi:hypothetical protein